MRRKKVTGNQKVRNATPCEEDGINFKSKLELFCYRHLKENNIEAAYEENKFTLVDKFEYNEEKVRPMTYTPDFVDKKNNPIEWIIECKGNMSDSFPLRWKLFKLWLFNMFGSNGPKLYLPRNQKQVLQVIEEIKNG